MTDIKECGVCEHPFDHDYETDSWDEVRKKHVCVLCEVEDDG